MTNEAKEAVAKIAALRRLTAETGVITKRTQNTLLAALTPEVLTEVALILNERTNGERNVHHTTKQ